MMKASIRVKPTGKSWWHVPDGCPSEVGWDESFYRVQVKQGGKTFWYGPETSSDGVRWYAAQARIKSALGLSLEEA